MFFSGNAGLGSKSGKVICESGSLKGDVVYRRGAAVAGKHWGFSWYLNTGLENGYNAGVQPDYASKLITIL